MPWRERSSMDERVQFVADFLTGGYTMSELCRRYNVSRPTGYALVERYTRAGGPAGLLPQSRRPHTSPSATPASEARAIIECRPSHPDWGPVKVLDYLRLRAPDRPWPAPSTAGAILKRQGLVTSRRRRRVVVPGPRPTTPMTAPSDVWTIDFKGPFRTRDGVWCYPLTVMDGATRYLLAWSGWPRHGPRRPARCARRCTPSAPSMNAWDTSAATPGRRTRRRPMALGRTTVSVDRCKPSLRFTS